MAENEALEERKMTMALMRKGYGIHPDRDIVVISNPEFTEGELYKALQAAAARYGEADFLCLTDGAGAVAAVDDDNIYTLPDLSDEFITFIRRKAILEFPEKESVSSEEFISAVEKGLEKEGFNRKGTTIIAVDEGDTTRKLSDLNKTFNR